MRVFLASIGPIRDAGRLGIWISSFRDALIAAGHDVYVSRLDWDRPVFHVRDAEWRRNERPALSEQLIDEVRSEHRRKHINLFFSYFYSAHVEPGAIQEIRSLGIPTVNFFCDAMHSFHLVSEIAPSYD